MSSSILLSDNGVTSGSAGIKSTGGNDGVLLLQTTTSGGTATTAVTVDNAQNVGIGTTSPAGKLDIRSSGLSGTDKIILQITDNVNTTFQINQTTSYSQIVANNVLTFSNGTTERMRLDSSGNLLVGTTTSSNNSGTGHKFDPNGRYSIVAPNSTADTFNYYNSTASAFRFYVTAGGTIFATNTTISAISDIRFKENIRDLDAGLSEVLALKPRLYDWKEGKGANIKNARGFIAQEFETVFPDLIDEWKDEAPEGEDPYKSVRQDLIPVLVKAIQEQQALIQSLTDRLTALEGAAK